MTRNNNDNDTNKIKFKNKKERNLPVFIKKLVKPVRLFIRLLEVGIRKIEQTQKPHRHTGESAQKKI